MFESFIFGPRINAVENDALLAGGDEVFGFGDSLTDDPIGAFRFANHLAEVFFAFAIWSAFNTALFHFFIDHAAKINFGDGVFGEIINDNGFAAAAHTDDSEDLDVFGICHNELIITHRYDRRFKNKDFDLVQ